MACPGVPVGIRAEFLPVLPVRYGLSAPLCKGIHPDDSFEAGYGLSIGRAEGGWALGT
jgi:hypothetical protein